MRKRWLLSLCATLLLTGSAQAVPPDDFRSLFRQVRADLQAGKVDSFVALPAAMHQYPLYPWLEYEYLKQTQNGIPDAQLLDFAQRNPHSLPADAIYTLLAQRLANRNAWQALLENIPDDISDNETRCYRIQALAATGKKDMALTQGKTLWLQMEKEFPAACLPVIALLRSHAQLTTDDYWQRIRAALDKNQTTLATQLAADLPPADQATVALWIEIRQDPATALPKALKQSDSTALRAAIAYGLERLAKKEPQTAESLWANARQLFKFTPAEIGMVESSLGMQQALRHNPAAITRLAAIPDANRTEEGNLWLARIALRENDWARVLQATQNLHFDNPRDAAPWQYWQARALEQQGKTQDAATLYSNVAQYPTFHGFLAADRLGQAYTNLKTTPVDRTQRMAGLQKVAAIQRAIEWFNLGEREQGRKEWFRSLNAMDQEGKIAAAELAIRSGDPNLAIWTLSRAKEWGEIDLRFPLAHTELVQEQARVQGIQAAWIMGVMRRESAFDATATSSADAFGLMQLILPTARTIGNKLGITISDKNALFVPDINVRLGAAYLKEMLEKFDGDYAQATAAYNAGPGRPPQWRPPVLINADQWVESIPFTETRDYVQAVMAYTTIYDYKLNQGQGRRLAERLQPITPNAKTSTTSPP